MAFYQPVVMLNHCKVNFWRSQHMLLLIKHHTTNGLISLSMWQISFHELPNTRLKLLHSVTRISTNPWTACSGVQQRKYQTTALPTLCGAVNQRWSMVSLTKNQKCGKVPMSWSHYFVSQFVPTTRWNVRCKRIACSLDIKVYIIYVYGLFIIKNCPRI